MKITLLGQGAMGSRMADRIEAAGHAVTRWNRSDAAATPREAVIGAQVVIAMLRDDEASRSVWLDPQGGALEGLAPDAVAIESSTLTQDWMRKLGQACERRGIAFLEAPVLGSRPQAEAGQLIHLLGGELDVIARVQPVLGAMGAKQIHVGPVGAGTALKLVANTLLGVQVAALAELLGRMRGLGLDPAEAIALLAQTPLLSSAAQGAAGLMLAGRDAAMFPVELVIKDLGYAIAANAAAMPLADSALAVFRRADANGWGAENLTAVRKLYTEE